ncbi:MAG: 50S ribosomal protein L7/L12 [Planctomycetota bacterium]|nr:50S ribosomal protein L7/L12 [Planctomycetota bacterium]
MATEAKVSNKIEEILDKIAALNLMELKELIDAYKARFGVEAVVAAPAVASAGAPVEKAEEKKEEAKTTCSIVIESVPEKSVPVIKVVRQVVTLGLKEAKDFVDSIKQGPKVLKEDVERSEAEKIKKQLEEAGATVSLK